MSEDDKKHGIDSDESAVRKIFIGGLNFSTDEDTLRSHFEKYGEVDDVVVMKDPGTNRSRGFGFITYVDIASVDNALSGNRVHSIDSRKVEAKRAVPRSEIPREERPRKSSSRNEGSSSRSSGGATKSSGRSSSKSEAPRNDKSTSIADSEEYANNKIFVGGLHYDTREESFRQYFSQFGKVMSAEVMFNRDTGKARGFGFIVFELEQGAIKTAAVKQHFIDGKEVEVKRAIPRSKLPSGTPTPSVLKNNSATTSSSSTVAATPPAVRRAESAPAASSTTAASGTSGVRKPVNTVKPSATVPVSQTRSVGSTSYAAALKQGRPQGAIGGESAPTEEQLQPESNSSESSADASSGSQLLLPNNTSSDVGQDGAIQTLLYGDEMNRPYRSNSEPVMEGSSALQGDVLPPDASRQSSAGAIRQTSNNSESSQLMSSNEGTNVASAGSTSATNNLSLPWLSNTDSLASSGIVGSGSLGMPASDSSSNSASGNAVGLVPPGMSNVSQLNTTQLQQQMQQMQQLHQLQMQQMQLQMQQMQQAAQLQSQTGGTMMPNGLFLPNTPNSNLFNMTAQQMQFLQQQQALGGAPSPDAWAAALMAQQNSFGGSTSGSTVGNQQQSHASNGIAALANNTRNSNSTNSGTGTNNQQQGQPAQSALFAQNAFGASQFPDYGYLNYMAAMSNGTGQLSDPNMMFYGNLSGGTGMGLPSPQFFPQQNNGNNRLGNRSGNQPAVGANSGGSIKNDGQSNAASTNKRNEESETDEIFKFNELNLGNSQFDPTSSSGWLS
mmetsp:Transcript_2106/g.5170  ORF Transcript_2106/g.5170 Transcript_2106/m.5170 type:complete len:781 (+) Transcript_2106:48-2390(+)